MPNHDKTRLVVTGDPETLLAFTRQYRTSAKPDKAGKTIYCLSDAFLPMPAEIAATDGQGGMEPPWYRWANANWGTKWGTYRESDIVSDDRIIITFESAWNPPWQLLATIRLALPSLQFEGTWYSEYDDMLRRFTLADDGAAEIEDIGEFTTYTEEEMPGGGWRCTTLHHFEMDGTPIVPPRADVELYGVTDEVAS